MTETQVKAGISKGDSLNKEHWHDELKSLLETHGIKMYEFDFWYDLTGRGLHELLVVLGRVIESAKNSIELEYVEPPNPSEALINQWLEEIKARSIPYWVQILIPFEGSSSYGTCSEWMGFDTLEVAIDYANEEGGSIWQDVPGVGRVRVRRNV